MKSFPSLPTWLALELLDEMSQPCALFDRRTGEVLWQNRASVDFQKWLLQELAQEEQALQSPLEARAASVLPELTDNAIQRTITWNTPGAATLETPVVLRPFDAGDRQLVAMVVQRPAETLSHSHSGQTPHHVDVLTGLPGRGTVEDRVRRLSLTAEDNSPFALLFLDLDGFKAVNDRWGHLAGDRVLATVASRLAAAVRGGDLIARYGGDEFVVLVEGITDHQDLAPVVVRLRRAVEEPISYESHTLQATVSIGAALSSESWQSLADLIRLADRRMYEEKGQSIDARHG